MPVHDAGAVGCTHSVVHDDAPVPDVTPGAQLAQVSDPAVALYVPAPQLVHVVTLLAPAVEEAVPAEHAVCVVEALMPT